MFNYELYYKDIFGGVCAIKSEQYVKANGFSNRFWGWGGEDDDLRKRIVAAGMEVEDCGTTCRVKPSRLREMPSIKHL